MKRLALWMLGLWCVALAIAASQVVVAADRGFAISEGEEDFAWP